MRMSTSWPGRADAGEMLAICEQGEMIVGRDGCGTRLRVDGELRRGRAGPASDVAIASPVAIAGAGGVHEGHP